MASQSMLSNSRYDLFYHEYHIEIRVNPTSDHCILGTQALYRSPPYPPEDHELHPALSCNKWLLFAQAGRQPKPKSFAHDPKSEASSCEEAERDESLPRRQRNNHALIRRAPQSSGQLPHNLMFYLLFIPPWIVEGNSIMGLRKFEFNGHFGSTSTKVRFWQEMVGLQRLQGLESEHLLDW